MATLQSQLRLSLLDQVSGPIRRISGVLSNFQRQTVMPLGGTIGRLAALGAGYVGVTQGVQGTVGAAMQFETAFADVRKVVNGTSTQLESFRRDILGLSKDMPITASGFAEIYAAAGQSGIANDELKTFAKTVAQVSTAWDVPVRETGQALAEIKTQLKLGVSEVGLFADALNHLSNNSAANAPKLLEFTNRVASQGEMFGFTAQQSLAFGGAMIAAGAESEVAATSFRNMGNALTAAGRASKEKREAFKRLGLDSTKTAKAMQKDALKTTLDTIDRIQQLTPAHRHVLDADSRLHKVVRVVIRTLRRVIDMLLQKHKHVHIVMASGNHDPASSVWVRELLAAIYENEPRVTVDTSPMLYYAYLINEAVAHWRLPITVWLCMPDDPSLAACSRRDY
ncbi:phage tail tape measure protein [Agrobacterium sp. MS2]|uniref:phage tail tape measure protein n=1 Tax=Agrobacterium sp. MS2 TaxID=1345498 RepID=UPI001878BABD|nr:phage tail tape measure protein [Agrobacterium sp. MS2]